ncbi:MAG: ArsR/SmtB family transcription factor [Pseudolabrys sp.]
MREGPDGASLGALIGDPARANILAALMAGKALTAGELAQEAGVAAPTASSHLAKLVDARLLVVEIQGRHRYFRLAGPEVAEAVEAIMGLAARMGRLRSRPGPKDPALRLARCCYDHLAGEMGAALYDALVSQGFVIATSDGIGLSPPGRSYFTVEGIDIGALEAKPRPLCRACLDWSERRHHLAGSLGAALLQLFITRGWARRDKDSRVVHFTPKGTQAFNAFLRVSARGPSAGLISEAMDANRATDR